MNIFELLFDFLLISIAGLFIAFSPMLIITNVLIVLRSKRPILHTVVLLLSIATPLLLLTVLAGLFVKPDSTISLRGVLKEFSLPPFINVCGGLILFVVGVQRFIRLKYRPLEATKSKKPIKAPPTKVVPLFMFGFMKTLLSVTNVFAILFVTNLIVSNRLNPLLSILIVVWTIMIGLVPFFMIFYYQKNRREYLMRLQARIDNAIEKNLQLYLALALITVGLGLGLHGLIKLIAKA